MLIQFLGAAGEVTGSKHLITTDSGKTILLDCGMYQGKGMETDAANRALGFDPKDIHYLLRKLAVLLILRKEQVNLFGR